MEPRPYDMFVYECSTHVDASPERVWEIVGDLSHSAEWAGSGQVRTMTQTTPGDVGVGTKYIAQEHILVPFKAESEILVYEPNRLICWTARPKGPDVPAHRWAFRLEPDGGETRVIHQVRAARSTGPLRLVQTVMIKLSGGTDVIVRGMEKTLANIKEQAESRVTTQDIGSTRDISQSGTVNR